MAAASSAVSSDYIPIVVAALALVLSGWWPDPTGRYQLRYWDGRLWTSGVITNGAQGVVPHPL